MKPMQNALGVMRDSAQARFRIMSIFVQKGSGRAKIHGRMMTEATQAAVVAVAQAVEALEEVLREIVTPSLHHMDQIILIAHLLW